MEAEEEGGEDRHGVRPCLARWRLIWRSKRAEAKQKETSLPCCDEAGGGDGDEDKGRGERR